MPRGHGRDCRRSSKVIASPIPGHLSSYPIFFMQVTKPIPSHDHIPHLPHRLWRSSGICAFILVLSSGFSRVPRVSPSSPPLTLHCPSSPPLLHSRTRPTLLLSCFSFLSSTVWNLWIPRTGPCEVLRSAPHATCCLYVLPYNLRCSIHRENCCLLFFYSIFCLSLFRFMNWGDVPCFPVGHGSCARLW